MKNITLFFLFSLLVLAACNSGSTDSQANSTSAGAENNASDWKSRHKSILFFGNSLTAAYNLSPEQGFTALIQKRLDSLGYNYTCVNAGVSGETTTDGLSRIGWVLREPVDVFVLELGANDALRGLDLKTTKANLQGIIDQVKSQYPGCKIIIAGMQAPPNLGAEYTRFFEDMYNTLSAKNGTELIPFLLAGVAADPKLNLEDGIHPNVEGQKIVAENVWKILKPVLIK
ncbi:MAG: arylesterase [Lewinellaceae bacterium]|nr:arylesterase [Lewinellaceae bacterium]